MYKLKPNFPDFEVVDGAFSGKKYEAGKTYHIVPPEEAYKFMLTEDSPLEGLGVDYSPPRRSAGGGIMEDNNQ